MTKTAYHASGLLLRSIWDSSMDERLHVTSFACERL
jgi:hypothetical protein